MSEELFEDFNEDTDILLNNEFLKEYYKKSQGVPRSDIIVRLCRPIVTIGFRIKPDCYILKFENEEKRDKAFSIIMHGFRSEYWNAEDEPKPKEPETFVEKVDSFFGNLVSVFF